MKKLSGASIVFLFLALGLAWAGEPGKSAAFSSEKPLFAKIALDEKGSKVLTLVFDESGGTGTGYDTIYADLNFNGDLSDDQPIKGALRKPPGVAVAVSCTFPPIDVDVPYNEKAKGVEKPCSISIDYYQLDPQRAARRLKGQPDAGSPARFFFVRPQIKLREGPALWAYLFSRASFDPTEKAQEAPAVRAFEDKPPALTVQTMPDPKKKGYLGIQAVVRVGGHTASPSKGGKPISADVQITNARGENVVHHNVMLNKLFFG